MVKRSLAALCLLILAVVGRPAHAQTNATRERSVPVRNPLATAQSLSFTAKLTYGSYGGSESARVQGQTFLVKARKPGCLRIEERLEDLSHPKGKFTIVPYNVLITNGKSQIDEAVFSKKYTLRPPAKSLAEVSSESGVDSLVCCSLLFAPDMLRVAGAKYEKDEEIAGQKVAMYRPLSPHDFDNPVWPTLIFNFGPLRYARLAHLRDKSKRLRMPPFREVSLLHTG